MVMTHDPIDTIPGKLYEYVNTVERSLQAAEILQAVACTDDKQRELWYD